mmetsp:Transcript_50641/g.115062  ORF Transcript_50641/g.115062 Transcript_50641/m.115062 type:complete len:378 (-) Transcript_50641:500-1633(-)
MTRSPLQQATDCEQACCVPEQRSPQATQPTQHRRAVAMAQLPAVLVVVEEDLLPQLLKHHRGLVHCILLRPHVSQSAAHVLHETIQVVVIHLQHQMDILQGTTTIISGSSQCRNDVVGLLPLDTLQLGSLEEHVDPLVALNTLVQSVDHGHHTVKTSQALKQLVHPICVVLLLRQLHPHRAPRSNIRPHPTHHQLCVHNCLRVHRHVLRRLHQQLRDHVEMVVRDVHVVVGWAQLGEVVLHRAAEGTREVLVHLATNLPLLGLGFLKMKFHSGILGALVIHRFHHCFKVLISTKPLQEGLPVLHLRSSSHLPAPAQHVRPDRLQRHQHLVNQRLRMPPAHQRACKIRHERVKMVVIDSQILVDVWELLPLVALGAPE